MTVMEILLTMKLQGAGLPKGKPAPGNFYAERRVETRGIVANKVKFWLCDY